MPVANELRFKQRIAPIPRRSSSANVSSPACGGGSPKGRRGTVGTRTPGTDQPTRFGGAGFGLRIPAQEKNGHAALGRTQHESPTGSEIKDPWCPRNFEDKRAEFCAGQRVEACAQKGSDIGRTQKQETARIEPQFAQAGRGNLPILQRGEIRPEPQEAPAPGHAGGQHRYKSGCRRPIAGRHWKNLVQRTFEKPAMQAGISPAMPQRHARLHACILQAHPGNGASQRYDFLRNGHDAFSCEMADKRFDRFLNALHADRGKRTGIA